MKTLYLVRHAKSSWKNSDLSDFDRPLNKRGKRDAPEMGERLARKKVQADLLIASPANRAYSTAIQIAAKIGLSEKNIKTDEVLYHADLDDLLTVIQKQNNQYDSLMLFGHNPGFTDLANYLSDEGVENIPTCGVFTLSFKTSEWRQVGSLKGELLFFDYPKKPAQEKFLS